MGKQRVFIIGGGPSLRGFDFNRLKNEDTIAVNHAVQYVVNPTVFITADSGVIRKAVENDFWDIPKETRKIVVMRSDHPRYANVSHLLSAFDKQIQPCRFDGQIGFHKSKFATGKNTGFCALQLAVLMKYKEIYLLGFDLGRVGPFKYFYSDGRGSDSPYDIFLSHFRVGLKILKGKGVKVISCSKTSRLNEYIPYVSLDKIKPIMPIFVSHYTKNTPYEDMAGDLRASLERFDLDYDIEGIDSLGNWRANSNWCCVQVQNMLQKHSPHSIVRVDVDAVIQQMPSLFGQSDFKPDIAACIWEQSKLRPGGEFMGGTLYFGNNERTKTAVDLWVKACADDPIKRNGDLLQRIVNKLSAKKLLKFERLPLSYCKIFDFQMAGVKQPVIEHFQASRKNKRVINRMGVLGHA